LNAVGGGGTTQAAITSTLANLSGVTKSPDGRRRLCMSNQFSVLNTGVNETKLLEGIRGMLSLSLANDLPVSFSIDATQWWGGREDLFNFWVKKRHFFRHLYLKCIILPRQARDKHRENSKQSGVSLERVAKRDLQPREYLQR
jgi:hypothetical protein